MNNPSQKELQEYDFSGPYWRFLKYIGFEYEDLV